MFPVFDLRSFKFTYRGEQHRGIAESLFLGPSDPTPPRYPQESSSSSRLGRIVPAIDKKGRSRSITAYEVAPKERRRKHFPLLVPFLRGLTTRTSPTYQIGGGGPRELGQWGRAGPHLARHSPEGETRRGGGADLPTLGGLGVGAGALWSGTPLHSSWLVSSEPEQTQTQTRLEQKRREEGEICARASESEGLGDKAAVFHLFISSSLLSR